MEEERKRQDWPKKDRAASSDGSLAFISCPVWRVSLSLSLSLRSCACVCVCSHCVLYYKWRKSYLILYWIHYAVADVCMNLPADILHTGNQVFGNWITGLIVQRGRSSAWQGIPLGVGEEYGKFNHIMHTQLLKTIPRMPNRRQEDTTPASWFEGCTMRQTGLEKTWVTV